MRAALYLLLLAAPAHAGGFGDGIAGVGAGVGDMTSTLGARAGLANARVGGMLAAEWRYVILGPNDQDYEQREHRLRLTASVVFPFQRSPESTGAIRVGGGFEGARIVGMGYFPPSRDREPTIEYGHGYVIEAGATFLWNVESLRLGVELAAGHSTYSGTRGDLLFVARFGR